MISVILVIVNWFTKNFKVVAVGLISLLIAAFFFLNSLLKKKNIEIDRLANNIAAYELMLDSNHVQNKILQLTINELKHSNDTLIQYANKLKKELKVKDKNLKLIQVINTEIKDTVTTVIKLKSIDFEVELKPNQLTTIIVSRKDSILTAKIDLKNQLTLFIEEKKEYRNRYKNGFIRFLHLDFKKRRVRKYQITNSNPLITVTDTRIIEVSK